MKYMLLVLCSCVNVPKHIAFGRIAAYRHEVCVQNSPCSYVSECHRQSEKFCLDAGYSKSCGNAELEGSCGSKLNQGIR